MALVGYGSSDDEEDETLEIEQQRLPDRPIDRTEADKVPDDNNNSTISHIQAREGSSSQNEQPSPSSPSQQHQAPGQNASVRAQASTASNPEAEAAAPPIGPQLGPSATPEAQVLPGHLAGPSFPPLEGAEDSGGGTGSQSSSSLSQPQPQPQKPQPAPAGSSPFTTHRTTLRDLTLPTVPNMDIPPSPPPGQIAHPEAHQKTTAKFEQFLALKKQGVHFNSKIAASSALRNPALTDKLMGFVDVDHRAQYAASTLPSEIWDPAAFPRWSYKEQLRQTQADVAAGRARGKGAPVAFVPSSAAAGVSAGQDVSDSQGKRKTRFDA